MKKFLIAVIVIILVLAGLEIGGSYVIGGFAEKRFRQTMSLLNEMPGVSTEVLSYQRHYFKSQAKVSVKFLQREYIVNSQIYHGPIVVKKDKMPVHFTLAYIVNQIEIPNNPVVLGWNMSFPYYGGANISSQNPSYSMEQANLVYKSSGWDAKGRINSFWNEYNVDVNSSELSVANKGDIEGPIIDFQGIKLHNDYQTKNETKLTHFDYMFDKIFLPKQDVRLENLSIKNEIKVKQNILDSSYKINLANINVAKLKTIGPERIELIIDNLDANALLMIWHGEARKITGEEAKVALSKILKGKPRFSLTNTEINLPEGRVTVEANMVVGGDNITDPTSVDQVVKSMEGDVFAKITKELFKAMIMRMQMQEFSSKTEFNALSETEKQATIDKSYDAFLDTLMKSNILKDQGTEYEIKAKFSKGSWLTDSMGPSTTTNNNLQTPSTVTPTMPETEVPKALETKPDTGPLKARKPSTIENTPAPPTKVTPGKKSSTKITTE